MYPTTTREAKIKLMLAIIWPILVTQVGYTAMNVVDTMMSGRAGTDDLAGVAIGSSLWMPIMAAVGGLLSVTPIIGQKLGQKRSKEEIAHFTMQTLYLAVLLAILVLVVGFFAVDRILVFMDLQDNVQIIAKHYLIGLSLGLIPFFASTVLRYFFDAHGFTRISMIIIVIAIPFNVFLNYVFIFGNLGFPRLGGIGAGYTTAITYWIIFLVSIYFTFKLKKIRPYNLFRAWHKPSFNAWKSQLSIGVPIGLSIFFEASIFSIVTLFMGTMFSTVIIAAHQAAINFASLLFMVPLSISLALTIFVAYEVGANRLYDAKQYAKYGVAGALLISIVLCLFVFLFRETIPTFYSDEPEVMALIVQFILFALFYQISDAAQASLQGVLRGYKDVTIPFAIAFVSYWIIGIPSGWILARFTPLGPFGFWIGIIIGLTIAGIAFSFRLRLVNRKLA